MRSFFSLCLALLLIVQGYAPGTACTFNTHPAQMLVAQGATRFPLFAGSVDQDCALAAFAFGYDAAAIGAH